MDSVLTISVNMNYLLLYATGLMQEVPRLKFMRGCRQNGIGSSPVKK
jgi:hypothetical protein